jgi:ABC-type sugar transport system substrate-binding protein
MLYLSNPGGIDAEAQRSSLDALNRLNDLVDDARLEGSIELMGQNIYERGVDVIAAACENREGISTALRKAQAKGIKVITYDADALADARLVAPWSA